MSRSLPIVLAASSAFASLAAADTPTFALIPDVWSANDMSPDGRFIVGESATGPYILDTTTNVKTTLPPAYSAIAISDDGNVVLGSIIGEDGAEVAAILDRTASEFGWTSLGFLPNANACPSRSNGYELSADGSIAVGLSWDGCSGRGFVWTEATGMQELQNLANGGNRASVVSSDGSVIAGFAQGSFSRTPAMWDDSRSGELLDPPNGDVLGEIHGMRDDGSVLLGEWDGDAVKWTALGGVEVIGDGQIISGWTGIPTDIADNNTVVGFDILIGNRRAWIQPNGQGPLRDLKAYLQVNGATIPGNTSLIVAQAISTDGRRIIGHGNNIAWIVTLPNCPSDINDDGLINVLDLLAMLGAWGNCNGICLADLNDDAVVNVLDLLIMLGAWGPCS